MYYSYTRFRCAGHATCELVAVSCRLFQSSDAAPESVTLPGAANQWLACFAQAEQIRSTW